jgi:hypothetical protein
MEIEGHAASALEGDSGPSRKFGGSVRRTYADCLPTYEENWQFLRDPNRHADPWDAIKYVLLGDNVNASFGGEARVSYERCGNGYLD